MAKKPLTASRYDNLKRALLTLRLRGTTALRFMEIGTFDGKRAANLIRHEWLAGEIDATAEYYGFDMFEAMTPDMSKAELSKSTLPPSLATVSETLKISRCKSQLFPGNTRESIQAAINAKLLPTMNLIFIDGGHSLETIESDWNACRQCMDLHTLVLFDDYYVNRTDYGCRKLIDSMTNDPQWPYIVELLDPIDHIEHNGLDIRMAKVTLR